MKVSGIYMIVNKINEKRYVGSAVNLYSRWTNHLCELRKGTHHSLYFQRAYHKYREENFEFIIMEIVKDLSQLSFREQTWLDYYQSYDDRYGYNVCRYANSCLGNKHSEEVKKIISQTSKDHWLDPEYRNKVISLLKGRKKSPEHKIKILEMNQERGKDPNFRKNQSVVAKKQWADPKFRAKMAEGFIRRSNNPKYLANLSASLIGRHLSPEHIAKSVEGKAKARNKRNLNFEAL